MSWKIVAQIKNEVIKMNLCGITKTRLEKNEYELRNNLREAENGVKLTRRRMRPKP